MPLLSAWHRLKTLLWRGQLERDLDDELAFHLAMREDEYTRTGLTREEARAAARRQFGNFTHFKEETRDMWMFPSFESVVQDTRYALRTLRKSPGFTLVAIAVLAIGIGANTAIFSLVDAVRARAMPYPEPGQLVELWGNVMRTKVERRGASYPDFLDWRAQTKSFDDMAAFDSETITLAGDEEPERIGVEFVSAPYFSLLGVAPARGRSFRTDEDDVAQPVPVVVISDGLWKRRFGGALDIVGRVVALRGQPFPTYTVIGVMPAGFKGLSDAAELWIPFALYAPRQDMAERGSRGFAALARMKPGVSRAAAQADLDTVSHHLEAAYPDTNAKRGVEISPLDVELFGELRPALLTLMAAVAFVLLIACANVANLLLARSEARRREIAVRTALGAAWTRLLRQLVTESCILTLIGAAGGLLLARATIRLLLVASPVTFPSFVAPSIDARVAIFTIAVSIACGILVGLAPGLHTHRDGLNDSLKESARGSDGRRSQRVRSGLVVLEVSLAVVLLVGAGLMIRSVRNLSAIDPGFDPRSVLKVQISIPRAAATPGMPSAPAIYGRTLLTKLDALPNVAAAALATDLPLDGAASATFYAAEGQPAMNAQNIPRAYFHRVSPNFFSTLRIPFASGRTFTEAEATPTAPAVIVSERVKRRFWPDEDAIGKRVKFGSLTSNSPWMSIVGVVGEVKYRGLPENPTSDPDIYLPFLDRNSQISLVLRTSVDPASTAASVRAAIRAADSSIAVYGVSPMSELVRAQTAQSRFTTWLMGMFAAAALILSSVGLYGVMSYLVTQRTREIGIRLALGAESRDILRMVLESGARLIAIGIAVGVAVSFALGRVVSSLLFGVTPSDASTIIAVAALAVVALVACYIPAVRAARVSPLTALRYE
ncbi:MAG TPA: ABC transporter permease [Vicinamibacterales bacterium]